MLLDVPAGEAAAAYDRLVADVGARMPRVRIEGGPLSPMLRDGVKTIIGVQRDPVFGPVVMFGIGGIFVEVLCDVTFRIAPFGAEAGRHMIGEIKGSAVLEGARGRPPRRCRGLGPRRWRACRRPRRRGVAGSPASRSTRCWCARAAPASPR